MEKRQHIRLSPQENAFAALRSASAEAGKISVGKIKNISLGGLAFEYLTDEESEDGLSQIDIFISSEHKFYLPKMPCKVVYDIVAPKSEASHIFFSSFISRQCGIQFEELEETTRRQLKMFLATHTKDACRNASQASVLACFTKD